MEVTITESTYTDSARDRVPNTATRKHRIVTVIKLAETGALAHGVRRFHSFHTLNLEINRRESSPAFLPTFGLVRKLLYHAKMKTLWHGQEIFFNNPKLTAKIVHRLWGDEGV